LTERDPNRQGWKAWFGRFLLDSDARIDSAVFQTGRWFAEQYERYSAFMDRFHVAGWRRVVVEIASEGATVGAAGKEGASGFRALADLTESSVLVRGERRSVSPGMGGFARVIVGRRSLVSYAFEPLRQLKESLAGEPSR